MRIVSHLRMQTILIGKQYKTEKPRIERNRETANSILFCLCHSWEGKKKDLLGSSKGRLCKGRECKKVSGPIRTTWLGLFLMGLLWIS